MDNYSLDTHALVWYIRGYKTLSVRAKNIIRKIFEGDANCFISSLSVLEAYYISLKHKEFIFTNFLKDIKKSNIEIVPFDQQVLTQALDLPKELDIHDRIIVATSIVTNTPLVTKDKILRSLFPLETIW